MPSIRKRIGYLPAPIIQDLINQISKNENLSQSKVVGILVEEALLARGLIQQKKSNYIKQIIKKLKSKNIRTSLFIEPNTKDIEIAKKINADCIEIHTGKFCNLFNKKKNFLKEINKIKKGVNYANKIGLEVHVGHGITFSSAKILSKINGIKEFNIGHFLIGESIFIGIRDSIKKFKIILKK